METMESKTIGEYHYYIMDDENPENPREEWDNLGTMICFHKRYSLGDKHNFDRPSDFLKFSKNKRKIGIVLPLYLYDHSGLTMNTTGFSCPWDSGQVGWIYITREKIHQEYGCQRISKKLLERVRGYLINEVKTYDQYLIGDVYGFRITKGDEEIDSCWGIYGFDDCQTFVESVIDKMIRDDEKVVV